MEGLKLYIFPDIGSVIMTIHFQKELKRKWLNKCIKISGLFITLKVILFFFRQFIFIYLIEILDFSYRSWYTCNVREYFGHHD